MVTTRNQANAPIAPCMFWRRIHRGCIMVTVTQYLDQNFDGAMALYKSLSSIKNLDQDRKKATLKMIEAQLDQVDGLDEGLGTAEEERKLAFVNRVLIEARRLCLK